MATPASSYTITAGVLQAYPSSSNPFIAAGPDTYTFLRYDTFNAMVASGAIITAVNVIPAVGSFPAGFQPVASWSSQSSVAAFKALDPTNYNLTNVVNIFLAQKYATYDSVTGIITFSSTVASSGGSSVSTQPLFLGAAKVTGINWDFKNSVIKGLIETTESTAPIPLSQLNKSVTDLQTKIDAITSKDSDLQSQITVVKTDLATESSTRSSADSTLTTNLASEVTRATAAESALQSSQIVPTNVPYSPAVYADADPPLPLPSSLVATSPDGWYYRNHIANHKVNWYIPIIAKLKYKEIKNIYANVSVISSLSCPFMVIYTKLRSSNNSGSWYGSKSVYDIGSINGNINAAGLYNFYTHYAATNSPNFTPQAWTKSAVFSAGTPLPDEEILAIAFSSNSASTVGLVEFVVSQVGIITSNETREAFFSNTDVAIVSTSSALTTETSARLAAEAALGVRADAEASARATMDTTLTGKIDTEASARLAADNALGLRVDGEASARATMDTTLTGKIDTEASARLAADAALQAQIDTLNASVTALNLFSKATNKVLFHNDNLTPPV
jgi:hypothetical protein